MGTYYSRIRVYDDDGCDTQTLIFYTLEEQREATRHLRTLGYTQGSCYRGFEYF